LSNDRVLSDCEIISGRETVESLRPDDQPVANVAQAKAKIDPLIGEIFNEAAELIVGRSLDIRGCGRDNID